MKMAAKLMIKALQGRFLFSSSKLTRNSSPVFSIISNSFSSKPAKDIPGLPKNRLEEFSSASQQADFGVIYDKKPFKFSAVKGKRYAWCACGKSKSQPLCDGTHRNPHLKITMRPVHFMFDEDKDVWLCNCKQTSRRPFCDGTHKREDIQAAIR
ncbi:hypothetical protein J437_LFUL012250 [Ladona fulva]|uniref:Iron-binding zinc finger CDGSH type domain-containing protein n=1 Tax=Ladona fulva TaxID=123851 RepID=A0A8K0KAG5_LADFU|nr:hypothetical protein J437_LFUL012250 [Ladona fulva]